MNKQLILNSSDFKESNYLTDSSYIAQSNYCYKCNNIIHSYYTFNSSFIYDSCQVAFCKSVSQSQNIVNSEFITQSKSIDKSKVITNSICLFDCENVNDSVLCAKCDNSNHLISCYDLSQAEYCVFNVQIDKKMWQMLYDFLIHFPLSWKLADFPSQYDIADALPPLLPYINPYKINDNLAAWLQTVPSYDSFIMYQITGDTQFLKNLTKS